MNNPQSIADRKADNQRGGDGRPVPEPTQAGQWCASRSSRSTAAKVAWCLRSEEAS